MIYQHWHGSGRDGGFDQCGQIVGKKMDEIKVVVNGVGAAGVACSKIIMAAGVRNIIGCDQSGALYRGRKGNMNWVKDWYAQNTNPNDEHGTIHEVIKGADVFLGLSVPGVIDVDDVKNMASQPIVFAMANPTPEIMPEEQRLCRSNGNGKIRLSESDQQRTALGSFEDHSRRASRINEEMKLAAANAIAGLSLTLTAVHRAVCV
jgi:malate dehydrogenase (oxaloacetate-decarboxylating)